jgi:hypothetical protein
VTVDSDGTIAQIDNCSCRRLVLSFSTFWWKCTGTLSGITLSDPNNKVQPGSPFPIVAGDTTPTLIAVKGTNLDKDATFTFGDGVKVTADNSQWSQANQVIVLSVTADSDAQPGTRPLIVVNQDCSMALAANAVSISPPPQSPVMGPKSSKAAANRPKKAGKAPVA